MLCTAGCVSGCAGVATGCIAFCVGLALQRLTWAALLAGWPDQEDAPCPPLVAVPVVLLPVLVASG